MMPQPAQSIRKQIMALLEAGEWEALDISHEVRIREKEVYEHLSHIARTAAAQKKKLRVRPTRCLDCGYVFEDRRRLTKPGRCPRCKGSHLSRPAYRIS